jgi:hypothetical protein
MASAYASHSTALIPDSPAPSPPHPSQLFRDPRTGGGLQ